MTESAGPIFSDDEAVTALHQELAPTLVRLAEAMLRDRGLAEDAVQDAFLLLAARCQEIPAQQRRGWLVRTVQYSALNLRRRRGRQDRVEQNWLLREAKDGYTAETITTEAAVRSEELEQVRTALCQLPEAQQLIVRLRLVDEKSFQQIADQLGLPLGTVLSRMRLAVEKLRSRLT